MNEYQALLIVSENNGKSIETMLAAAHKAGHTDIYENKERFSSLYSLGYIEGAFACELPVSLTLSGKDRLEQLKEEATAIKRNNREVWIDRIWSFVAGVAATVLAQYIINALF